MSYYSEHREECKAYWKRYYAKNRERYIEKSMEWQRSHPLEMSDIHRRYYLKNGDEIRRKAREYYHRKKAMG